MGRMLDIASPTAGASYLIAVASIATGREDLAWVRDMSGEVSAALVPAQLVRALQASGIRLCECGAAIRQTAPGDWCTVGSGDYFCPADPEGGHHARQAGQGQAQAAPGQGSQEGGQQEQRP
jgi:hypothetical protein